MTDRQLMTLLTLGAVLMLGGSGQTPVEAGMVFSFEPSLEISLVHDGDVYHSTTEESQSDELAMLRAVLPLVGRSERTTMTLSYAPMAEFYSTYDELNQLNHRAELALNRTFRQRGSWDLGGSYVDTSDAHSDLLTDEIVLERSGRQLLTANTGFAMGVSSRVDLSFRYLFRSLDFDDPEYSGYSSHQGGVAAELVTGPRSRVGVDYGYQYFLYPDSDDHYGVHNLLARYTIQPTAQSTLTLAGGAYFQEYQPAEAADGDVVDGDRNGFLGSIDWGREGRRFGFSVGLQRAVRASGGIGESVLSNALRLGLTGQLGRRMDISFTGNYQQNEPTVTEGAGVDLMRFSMNLGYEFNRHFRLRFFADYIDQQWEAEEQRDLGYPRVGLTLVISRDWAGGGL